MIFISPCLLREVDYMFEETETTGILNLLEAQKCNHGNTETIKSLQETRVLSFVRNFENYFLSSVVG